MKILQVISSYPPAYDYGGPPRSVYNLSLALKNRGQQVTVFTTDALDAKQRAAKESYPEIDNGIEVHRFRNLSNTLSWKNFPLAPRMAATMSMTMKEYDIVHTHEYRSFHTIFAHVAAKMYNVPHVLQPRGSMPRHAKSRLKRVFDTLTGRKIVHGSDRIVASSQVESNQFTDVVPDLDVESICHVPNAVSAGDYEVLPDKGTLRRQLGLGANAEIVLFLSRLHPRKGGDRLIEAINELRKSREEIYLVIAGPDEGDRYRLERLVEYYDMGECTFFTGPLYGEEKKAAYVDADAFVLPSINEYESFGNVVLEAMACGTPAVATNVCGVAEWIEHPGCRTVEPTDHGLKEGISEILNMTLSGPSIQDYVWKNFTWETVADRTESIYSEIIQ